MTMLSKFVLVCHYLPPCVRVFHFMMMPSEFVLVCHFFLLTSRARAQQAVDFFYFLRSLRDAPITAVGQAASPDSEEDDTDGIPGGVG